MSAFSSQSCVLKQHLSLGIAWPQKWSSPAEERAAPVCLRLLSSGPICDAVG